MLTLNGVTSRGHVWFVGLDVRQCPIHGDTIFENENDSTILVALAKNGKSGEVFKLLPKQAKLFDADEDEELIGEFTLVVIISPVDTIPPEFFDLVANTEGWSTHTATIKITRLDRSGSEVS